MRSQSFITGERSATVWLAVVCVWAALSLCPADIFGQRIALLAPNQSESDGRIIDALSESLASPVNVLDPGLSQAAFKAVAPATPLNMTTTDAKRIGAAIGCDAFILIRSDTLRRSSSSNPEYYEAFAAMYVVSSRTGRLVSWTLPKVDGVAPKSALDALLASVRDGAGDLISTTRTALASEAAEPPRPDLEEPPADDSPDAKRTRAPIPYRRIKPEYTASAFLYEIAATVDIEVDIDATGRITRAEIVRWAGYGLDESVEKTVREMNWRPAERNAKSLPMRVLLRYNFKKIDHS